jgi:hypothetical protein
MKPKETLHKKELKGKVTTNEPVSEPTEETEESEISKLKYEILLLKATIEIYEDREDEMRQAAQTRGGPIITTRRKEILANEFKSEKKRNESWKDYNERINKNEIRIEKARIASKAKSGLADLIFILEHWDFDPEWINIPDEVNKIITRPNHTRIDNVFEILTTQRFIEMLTYRYLRLEGDIGKRYIIQLIYALQRSLDRTWNSGDFLILIPQDSRPVPRGIWNVQLSFQTTPLSPELRAAGF